ncbi:MAG: class I SAM-dependent methyltransferase [Planctomycetaceae bacterium]|nr:class I SAM-dependent methyltransferase [Planctomycetaceae bacterium]
MADHADHYDHYSSDQIKRLDGFFGDVNRDIDAAMTGQVADCDGIVLDFGCGFGSLVDHLRSKGHEAVGIDMLDFCVNAGKQRFPQADLRCTQGGFADWGDKSVDAVLLKDVIHHIADEDDVTEFLDQVKRVARKKLVISDPNPTWIVRFCRWLIGHIDPALKPNDAVRLLTEHGFRCQRVRFSNLMSLPLSGGYVGRPLVPSGKFFSALVRGVDKTLTAVLNTFGAGRLFCWRYLLVAEIPQRQAESPSRKAA